MSSALNPGRSVSTRKPRILSSSFSTLAQITATSAMVPEVIHIFSPLSTYSLPTFSGAGPHAAGVRAEARLSQAEAAELFALLHGGQPGILLLVDCRRHKSDTSRAPTAR